MKRLLILLTVLPTLCWASPVTMDGPCKVYFSPSGGATTALVELIGSARKSVRVLAYSFTSKPIAAALVTAHGRGVDVRVVADKSVETNRSVVSTLRESGIPVWIDREHAIQHNKVLIVDDSIIELGSFNYSAAAEYNNAENVLICPSVSGAARYADDWNQHRLHSEAAP